MIRTASVSELREKLAETIDRLEADTPLLVVRHSKPAAYLVSTELFEGLIERIEDLEDQRDMLAALHDFNGGLAVDAEEVFKRLGL